MREFTVWMVLALGIVLQVCSTQTMSFNIVKAIVSPPMPRVTRIRNISPRDIKPKDPFAVFDFLGLVKQYNYPVEEHNVTTTDGYKLIFHRIPGSPTSPPAKKKPLVLLQHGVFASTDTFVLVGPGKDLAFLLADAGYDVWLNNVRGNTYCRSHVALSPEDPAFWQFSQHEMGYYDLPAVIDYALEETGHKNLTYIGHSMGTTVSYILLSTRPEYNERMRLVISLAPVSYWKHTLFGWIKVAVDNGDLIEDYSKKNGINEIFPQSDVYSRLAESMCGDKSVTRQTCSNLISTMAGIDRRHFNVSFIPYVSKYLPSGGSFKTLLHYRQNILSGTFSQFDYGYVENFQHYKQKDPPAYNMSKVTAPVALFSGKRDILSTEEDAEELEKRLPNVVTSVKISDELFNHFSFIWNTHAKEILYDDVINLIHKFN